MINRDGYRSLLESVQQATTELSEGPDWESHIRGKIPTSPKNAKQRANVNTNRTDSLWLSKGSNPTADAASINENFDELDAILMEGIEIYGEDGMAFILEHFEATGQLSEELYELLTVVEAKSTKSARPSDFNTTPSGSNRRPMSDRIRNPLNVPKFPRKPEPMEPYYTDPDNDNPYDPGENSDDYRPTGKSKAKRGAASKGAARAQMSPVARPSAKGPSIDSASMG